MVSRVRLAALLAAGALGVHEGRYLLGYGSDADRALAQHGHAYLSLASALTGGLVVVAGLALALGLSRARPAPSRAVTWLRASAALGLIYTAQELAEGAFSPGHPVGVAGVFGHGGWTAFGLALAFGALIAALELGAREVVPWSPPARLTAPPPPAAGAPLPEPPALRLIAPLASSRTGRGPPLAF